MHTIDRIYQFIDYKGLSLNEFSKRIEVSNGYLAKQKARSANIGSHIIEKIVREFPEINAHWLITGLGIMLNKDIKITVDNKKRTNQSIKKEELIPLIPTEAYAGMGAGVVSIMDQDISERYTIPDFVNVDFMIRVKGSSMYPKYNSGDIVACKMLSSNQFIQWNKVHVIATKEQGVLIKRLKKGKEKDHLICISDNPSYDPFEIPREEILNMALVVGVVRLE